MALSYNKLFKLLIDKNLKKKDLCEMADVSTSTVTKLAQGKCVSTDMLDRICCSLNCDISDIVESVKTEGNNNA